MRQIFKTNAQVNIKHHVRVWRLNVYLRWNEAPALIRSQGIQRKFRLCRLQIWTWSTEMLLFVWLVWWSGVTCRTLPLFGLLLCDQTRILWSWTSTDKIFHQQPCRTNVLLWKSLEGVRCDLVVFMTTHEVLCVPSLLDFDFTSCGVALSSSCGVAQLLIIC